MVESPQALLYEPLDSIDPDEPTKKATEPDLLLVKEQPITSTFRSTIKHLHAKGGFRARFRGFSLFFVQTIAISSIAGFLASFLPILITPIIATVVLANLGAAWTHIVISDPSPKPWYRRLPRGNVWKKIAGPTTLVSVSRQMTIFIPLALAKVYGLDMDSHHAVHMTKSQACLAFWKLVSVAVLAIVLGCLLVIPADVALTRVQASLLPDDQETIVPFDRSFGGKVTPEIVGGTGVIGLVDAWKTFDRSALVRLVKAYVKVFAMQMALSFMFLGIFVAQIFIIIGKSDLKKIIDNHGKGKSGEL